MSKDTSSRAYSSLRVERLGKPPVSTKPEIPVSSGRTIKLPNIRELVSKAVNQFDIALDPLFEFNSKRPNMKGAYLALGAAIVAFGVPSLYGQVRYQGSAEASTGNEPALTKHSGCELYTDTVIAGGTVGETAEAGGYSNASSPYPADRHGLKIFVREPGSEHAVALGTINSAEVQPGAEVTVVGPGICADNFDPAQA